MRDKAGQCDVPSPFTKRHELPLACTGLLLMVLVLIGAVFRPNAVGQETSAIKRPPRARSFVRMALLLISFTAAQTLNGMPIC